VTFLGRPAFRHDRPDATGVLLVNLGTPEAPTTGAVRHYLREFLSDPRVVEVPRLIWWPILHGFILRTRPRRSARAYQQVWTPEGSPLLQYSRALAARVGQALGADASGGRLLVRVAMRYGPPSIPTVLREMQDAGVRRLLVLPLYPQYSATTTASVFDAVFAELRTWRWVPELRTVAEYFNDPAHLDLLAARIRAHRETHGEADKLLFSFHGIPERFFRDGDPYFCQCQATAREVAQRLDLPRERWMVSFQSRVGREPWLKPYTDETLGRWPGEGVKSVQVVCPGFAVDCLETIEEIGDENREHFLKAGGERYEYIAALNAEPDHVQALAGLLRRHLHGWDPLDADAHARNDAHAIALRSRRHDAMAQQIGEPAAHGHTQIHGAPLERDPEAEK
jgi:protoporphyrin/coproporphyrin ferrochelatase